jgi:hypothetical protein
MIKFAFLIALCLLSQGVRAQQGGSVDLEKLEYENTRDVSIEILKRFSPLEYVYMGVGRSPVAPIRYMQNLGEATVKAFNVPLTDFYARPVVHPDYAEPLNKQEEANLWKHFERFIPTAEQLQGKKLLSVDFAIGGKSQVAQEEYLSKFLAERRPGVKMEILVLTGNVALEYCKEAGKNYHVMDVRPYKVLATRMAFFHYLELAQHDGFERPFENSAALKDRPQYAEFGLKLKRFMDADPIKPKLSVGGCRGTFSGAQP